MWPVITIMCEAQMDIMDRATFGFIVQICFIREDPKKILECTLEILNILFVLLGIILAAKENQGLSEQL